MKDTELEIERLKTLSTTLNHKKCVSTYKSKQQQDLSNIPILKPLLVVVLNGCKIVGNETKVACNVGNFVFFTDVQTMNMRNIPANTNYLAVLVEFEFSDFDNNLINNNANKSETYTFGKANSALYKCISQLVECLDWATEDIIENRRKEIINLLANSGYPNLAYLPGQKETTLKVIEIFKRNDNKKITIDDVSKEICMSKATLYRKLKFEGENIQKIKEKVLMGRALHLLQTSSFSTEHIATMVGYSSTARFSQRFRAYFGLSPKELKNTKRI